MTIKKNRIIKTKMTEYNNVLASTLMSVSNSMTTMKMFIDVPDAIIISSIVDRLATADELVMKYKTQLNTDLINGLQILQKAKRDYFVILADCIEYVRAEVLEKSGEVTEEVLIGSICSTVDSYCSDNEDAVPYKEQLKKHIINSLN